MSRIGDDRLALVGVFDSYRGDATEISVWILESATGRRRIAIAPEKVAHADSYPVDAGGALGFQGAQGGAYRVEQYTLPACGVLRLAMKDRETGEVREIEISKESIIRDEDLRSRGE